MEQQVFCVRIEGFTLPKNVKRKWEQGREAAASARNATLENLEIKLQAAEQRRETIWEARRSKANRYRVRTVHDPSAALERLEKRLAAAEAKRLAVLHAVKVRAAVTANRAAAVARAEATRRKQLQSRLQQSLEAAEVARAAHLADTAARAARTSSKALASARVAKQREQTQAASRLTTLLHRMKRAEASREQVLVARKESAAAVAASAITIPSSSAAAGGVISMSISPLNTASTLLGDASNDVSMMARTDSKTATHHHHQLGVIGPNAGQWLRRQAAARRIQRCWRSFASKNGTTEDLVRKFAATKIPFSCAALSSTETTETPTSAAEAGTGGVDADSPTPGCNSPRSTLTPGNVFTTNASGNAAPANTPAESTPVDTPRAGSPPLYGPPTPPMPVPIPSAGTGSMLHQQQQGYQRHGGVSAAGAAVQADDATGVPSNNNLAEERNVSDSVSSMALSLSPSPRRQPVARLASSLAEMAASASHHENTPAPLPASFHASALSFDEFAEAMSATETLKAAQAVLRRFEDMGKVKESLARGNLCEGLLKRLFPKLPKGKRPDRYPPRAFLSAYMIQAHPEVVLSQQGPRETALAQAAATMLTAFETLLSHFLNPRSPPPSSSPANISTVPSLLREFDESWVAYLELFIAWKSHDAAGLESELIRAAVELETSRLLKIGSSRASVTSSNASGPTTPSLRASVRAEAAKQDLEALVEGVDHDLKLISERVERLTGRQGVARLEAALAAARASAEQQQQLCNSTMMAESPLSSSPPTTTTTTTTTTPGNGAPSPSNSPAKKVQRRQGRYANTSSTSPSSSLPSSPKQASPTEETAKEENNSPQQQQQQADGNLVLMWQLLYDSSWHLPMDEAEASWKDAVGETDPMAEPAPTPQDMEAMLLHQGQGSEALAAALHNRVRRIGEKAFWDELAERLSGGGNGDANTAAGASPGQQNPATNSNRNIASNNTAAAVSAAVSILAESGAALLAVLPEGSSAAADVSAQLGSVEKLTELLTATPNVASSSSSFASLLPGINCEALFQMLEWCGGLLRRLGAPAREAAAATAQASIRKELASVTTCAAAGKVVARALRLLVVLLKVLRLDMANAHLGMLARQLGTTPERAALCARSKMEEFLGNTPAAPVTPSSLHSSAKNMALKLPHTRGWLALASGRLPHVEALLSETASSQDAAALLSGVPRRLTTGRGTSSASSTTANTTTTSAGLAGQLAVPMSPRTWQGLVRCGLAQLVAGEGAVTHLALPETLRPDAGRLQAAQNEFQRLVVLTASLLALQHATRVGAAASGSAPGSSVFVSTNISSAETVKRRLSAVLASPDVCLADVAAEITLLAQAPQQEASVNGVLRNMLGKSSAALRSITSALCNALTAHLVLGPSSSAAVNASNAALTRCGAGALSAEVASLAGKLAQVAAVTEAVCAPWYEILSSDLLINTGH